MSKKDCETADWYAKGYQDAINGRTLETYRSDKKKCEEFQIAVDEDRFFKGRRSGLKAFCTYKSGYEFGSKGKKYKNTCPEKVETEFFKGYVAGKQAFEFKKQQEEMQKQQEQQNARLRMASRNGKACSFDSECIRPGNCTFSKCNGNGKACTFNSDCDTRGRCVSDSEYAGGEWIKENFCKFDP